MCVSSEKSNEIMSDYLTPLPVELMHKILDDVSILDIFLSMSLVNKRLRSVCLSYSRFKVDFSSMVTSMNKSRFDCICTRLLRSISQVVSLTLFDKTDPITPAKNELFFSRFNCTNQKFANLHSLRLTYITYDTWCLFKFRLSSLIVKLSIHLVHTGIVRASQMTTSDVLSELLLYSSSLKHLSLKMSNYTEKMVIIRPQNPTALSSIQYFHLDDITIDLLSFFPIVPVLHTLEIRFAGEKLKFGHIHPPSLHLQQLRIELWSIAWTQMTNILLSFPQLAHLIVIADDLDSDMADGFAWARLLQEVKHFKCKLQFFWDAFISQPINVNSFRTKFWLEEKKWFLTYDEIAYTGCSILYSNLYSIDDHLSHPTIGILASNSNRPQPTSVPHIICSTLNYQYLNSALLHQLIYVNEVNSLRGHNIFPMTFRHLYYYLDVSRIIISYSRPGWIEKSPDELIDFLRNLSDLRALSVSVSILNYLILHQWSDIVYLRIEPDFEDSLDLLPSTAIQALCHSFPHIKRLDIHSSSVSDLPQLLNRMKMTLTDIIIRQPQTVNYERLITRQWIEQNSELKNFHYSCDVQNCVSLWF